MSIPKIIHQIWIGTKPAPTEFMDTWRDKNPDFDYIRWNEEEIVKRDMNIECSERIDEMEEINGKADIIRWEILYKYGGVFLDADSICIEGINDVLLKCKCFAGWEHEKLRPGLIATGTMGFPPKHPLVKEAIDWIKTNSVNVKETGKRAWLTVGPGLLTQMYNTGKFKDLTIFPSYSFLPIHHTGSEYTGHGKVYAYQEWGSTKHNYDIMNSIQLPQQYLKPSKENSVSILISSFNTKAKYVQECLESIKHQQGQFNIEVVWINDGSDDLHTTLLKRLLDDFIQHTRFVEIVYNENDGNKGIGFTLNKGIELCNNEIIIKMDSDDIMVPNRIITQMSYMTENPDTHICGAQIEYFNISDRVVSNTDHKSMTWEEYKINPIHWFINHPTLCYRKSSVLEAGNYNKDLREMAEDFDLELRMLKTFGYIHNMSERLLYYRIHDQQVTHNGGKEGKEYWNDVRNDIINKLTS